MARKSVVKLHAIFSFFKSEPKLLEKGENAYESKHVISYIYDKDFGFLKGKVHASMKDKAYNVEVSIYFTVEGTVKSSVCTCPRGQVCCHHMAALLLHGHHNISVTDISCSWSAKKALEQTEELIKTVSDLYPMPEKKKNYCGTSSCMTSSIRNDIYERLKKGIGPTIGFTWLLSPEPQVQAQPTLIDLIFSEEFEAASNKHEMITTFARLNKNDIDTINKSTIGQSKNPRWLIEKRNRLTASNFGLILKACERNRFPLSLFKTLSGSYSLSGIKSINWGVENEEHALVAFQEATGLKVTKCGIFLHESGLLGASPDGVIESEQSLLEIKCPYKYRNEILHEVIKTDSTYFLIYNHETNSYEPQKDHNYYHQIQGQMHIANVQMCNFMVWTPSSSIILEIYRDEDWVPNIDKLIHFYLSQYLPYLMLK